MVSRRVGPAQWRGAGWSAGGSIIGPSLFWFFLGQCQKEQSPLTQHQPFTIPSPPILLPPLTTDPSPTHPSQLTHHQPIRNHPVTTQHITTHHNQPLITPKPLKHAHTLITYLTGTLTTAAATLTTARNHADHGATFKDPHAAVSVSLTASRHCNQYDRTNSNGHDHIPPFSSGLNVRVGLADLFQSERPVNHRFQAPRFQQFSEKKQTFRFI